MQGYETEVQFDGRRYHALTPPKRLARDATGETIFTTASESIPLFCVSAGAKIPIVPNEKSPTPN